MRFVAYISFKNDLMRKKIKFAVIGLGFGEYLLKQLFATPEGDLFDVVAVCDIDEAKASKVGKVYGCVSYTDIDDMLECCSIDAVGLFSPPKGRASLIRKIIESGRHVMTTKPFELNAQDAYDVLQDACRLGKVIHLNSPTPMPPVDLGQVLMWQKEYKIGQPIGFHMEVTTNYREVADGSWYDDPSLCPVAPIFRIGVYRLNDMIALLGEAESVQVTETRVFTKRPTPDNALIAIKFRSGAIGTIFASFCIDDGCRSMGSAIMHFEKGTIWRNIGPLEGAKWRYGADLVLQLGGEKPFTIATEIFGGVGGSYQWEYFYNTISSGALPDPALVENIMAGIMVFEAMKASSLSGRTEQVKPVSSLSKSSDALEIPDGLRFSKNF